MTTVRSGGTPNKVRDERMAGYVIFFTNSPAWERWLRHHTAIGETGEEVVNVAAKAVAKLPEWAGETEYETAILDALRAWRAKRVAGVKVPSGRRRPSWANY